KRRCGWNPDRLPGLDDRRRARGRFDSRFAFPPVASYRVFPRTPRGRVKAVRELDAPAAARRPQPLDQRVRPRLQGLQDALRVLQRADLPHAARSLAELAIRLGTAQEQLREDGHLL